LAVEVRPDHNIERANSRAGLAIDDQNQGLQPYSPNDLFPFLENPVRCGFRRALIVEVPPTDERLVVPPKGIPENSLAQLKDAGQISLDGGTEGLEEALSRKTQGLAHIRAKLFE
jgi:hypothetical protein